MLVCFVLLLFHSAVNAVTDGGADESKLLREGCQVFDGAKILTELALDFLLHSENLTQEDVLDIVDSWMLRIDRGRVLRSKKRAKGKSDLFVRANNRFLLLVPYTKVREKPDALLELLEDLGGSDDVKYFLESKKIEIINYVAGLAYQSWVESQPAGRPYAPLDAIVAESAFDKMQMMEKRSFKFFGQEKVLPIDLDSPVFVACIDRNDRVQQIAHMFAGLFSDEFLPVAEKDWNLFLWTAVLIPVVRELSNLDDEVADVDTVMESVMARAAPLGVYYLTSHKGAINLVRNGGKSKLVADDVQAMLANSPFVQRLSSLLKLVSKKRTGIGSILRHGPKRALIGSAIQDFLWMCGWKESLHCVANQKMYKAASLASFLVAQRFAGKEGDPLISESARWCAQSVALNEIEDTIPGVWTSVEHLAPYLIGLNIKSDLSVFSESEQTPTNALHYMQLEAAINELLASISDLMVRSPDWKKEVIARLNVRYRTTVEKTHFMYAFIKYMKALQVLGAQQNDFKMDLIELIKTWPNSLGGEDQIEKNLWSFAGKWCRYSQGDAVAVVDGVLSPDAVKSSNLEILKKWAKRWSPKVYPIIAFAGGYKKSVVKMRVFHDVKIKHLKI